MGVQECMRLDRTPRCVAVAGKPVGVLQVPATRAGYALSTAEQFVGLLLSALLLGAVVTKASIPSAKLVFSKVRLRGDWHADEPYKALALGGSAGAGCRWQHGRHGRQG